MIKTQFTLYLVNRPGELARATEAFATAQINIEGISVAERTDVSLVQVIVSNARRARQALKKAGIPASEQKVAILALANKPGGARETRERTREKEDQHQLLVRHRPAIRVGTRMFRGHQLRRLEESRVVLG